LARASRVKLGSVLNALKTFFLQIQRLRDFFCAVVELDGAGDCTSAPVGCDHSPLSLRPDVLDA
jgi:hypothetical protein